MYAIRSYYDKIENIEILNIRDTVDTNIAITGQDILNMVDNGTQLTVLADNGDRLDLTAFTGGERVGVRGGLPYGH